MKENHWFIHVEWVVVLVTLLSGFYLLDGKIERQGERTDRLYEMFVQNQKDFHDKIEQVHQKFYDILKEKK